MDLPITTPYRSIDDVVEGLTTLEHVFHESQDERAIFATTYLIMTRTMQSKISQGFFLDGQWVTRLVIAFSELYRNALDAYENDRKDSMPEAWRISFDTAAAKSGLAIQDLVLGINAHINRDLPYALEQVCIEPYRERYHDHNLVNQVLKAATAPVEEAIGRMYAPGLCLMGRCLGPLGVMITNFDIDLAREHAWRTALRFAQSPDPEESACIRQATNSHAALLSHCILSPTEHHSSLVTTLRRLEQFQFQWHHRTSQCAP